MFFDNECFMEETLEFEKQLNKVDVFIEASYRELNINYQESEIKVLKENGTDDDLSYLMEEAQASFKERAKATLKKIPEMLREWYAKMKEKFIDFINSIKEAKVLVTIKEKIKKDPKVANTTVETTDDESYEKEMDKHTDKIKSIITKIRGKKTASQEDIDAIEKEAKAAEELKPAKTKISVARLVSKFEEKISNVTKKTDDGVKKVSGGEEIIDGMESPEAVQAVTKAHQKLAVIEKLKFSNMTKSITDAIEKCKKVVKGEKVEETTTAESAIDDFDSYVNSLFTEKEKTECCEEVKDLVKDMKDALEDNDVEKAAELAANIKDKLDECCEGKESKEDKKDDEEDVEESASFLDMLGEELFG